MNQSQFLIIGLITLVCAGLLLSSVSQTQIYDSRVQGSTVEGCLESRTEQCYQQQEIGKWVFVKSQELCTKVKQGYYFYYSSGIVTTGNCTINPFIEKCVSICQECSTKYSHNDPQTCLPFQQYQIQNCEQHQFSFTSGLICLQCKSGTTKKDSWRKCE